MRFVLKFVFIRLFLFIGNLLSFFDMQRKDEFLRLPKKNGNFLSKNNNFSILVDKTSPLPRLFPLFGVAAARFPAFRPAVAGNPAPAPGHRCAPLRAEVRCRAGTGEPPRSPCGWPVSGWRLRGGAGAFGLCHVLVGRKSGGGTPRYSLFYITFAASVSLCRVAGRYARGNTYLNEVPSRSRQRQTGRTRVKLR